MLVLTRKAEESIMIENNIEIKVLKIQGNQVHLGITAPKHISIYRQEIYRQVQEANRTAVQTSITTDKFKQLEENLGAFRQLLRGK